MKRRLAAAALALCAAAAPAAAQAPPADGSLLFNADTGQWVFRAGGVPQICLADGRCLPLRFERLPPQQIAGAEIAGLGFAEGGFYLAVRAQGVGDGRAVAYRCTNEACAPAADVPPGDFTALGTFAHAGDQGRPSHRAAFLVRGADAPDRARLMLCGERGCAEQPFTRDNPGDFTVLGQGAQGGQQRVWLRDRSGAVHACGLGEPGDRVDCVATGLFYPETGAPAAAEADPQALVAAIEEAIRRGNLAEAERLIAEGRERFPNAPQWAQLDRRIQQMRADRDNRLRLDRVRRLVADARRYAQAGDYRGAEAVLQEAERIVPGAPEIAQARAEINRLRAERFERYRERQQLAAAIDQALANFRLWEAESLIAEALRRYPNDPQFQNYAQQVAQLRAEAEWQRRVQRAQGLVAAARNAMNNLQFDEAARLLDQAEALAMGLPEIRAARGELARIRAEADVRAGEINQFTNDINAALARGQIGLAEQILAFAMRRHPGFAGWAEMRRRIDMARAGQQAQIQPIILGIRGAIARRDWIEAQRLLNQLQQIDPNGQALQALRGELAAARAGAAQQAMALVNNARAAIARRDFAAAENFVQEAERVDPQNPAVRQVRGELNAAKASPPPIPPQLQALLANARAAMQQRNWPEADRLLRQAEQIDPNNPAVRQMRADLTGQRDAAARAVQPLIGQARAAMAQRDFAAAETATREAERVDPFNPAVRQLRADLEAAKAAPPPVNPAIQALLNNVRAAMAQRNWPEANRLLRQAEQADPNNPAVRQARADLTAAANAAGQQAQGFVATARAAIARRDFAAAEAAVRQAEQVDPTNPDVRRVRADLEAAKTAPPPIPPQIKALLDAAGAAMQRGDWAEADRLLREAERIDANHPVVREARNGFNQARIQRIQQHVATARAALARGDIAAAEQATVEAERVDPNNPAVRQLRADVNAAKPAPPLPPPVLAQIGQARQAIANKNWADADNRIRQLEQGNPNAPQIRQLRADFVAARDAAARTAQGHIANARAALARRDLAAAEAETAAAERADPTNPAVRQLRADVNAAKNAAGPTVAQILQNARQAMAQKNWPVADRLLQQAEQREPNNPSVRAARVDWVQMRDAAGRAALPILQRAGQAVNLGNKAEAQRLLAQAEQIDPHGDATAVLRRRVQQMP